MITNILDIAKADEGRLAPMRESVEAEKLVGGVVEELQALAASAGVTLVTSIEASHVYVDPDLMHRVLANLVENAIRHAPEGSRICVELEHVDRHTTVRVADAGTGVPQQVRGQIFERFQSGAT